MNSFNVNEIHNTPFSSKPQQRLERTHLSSRGKGETVVMFQNTDFLFQGIFITFEVE